MSKIASNPEGTRVYVIGGAKDSKSKQTIDSLTVYHISLNQVTQQHLACMNDNRASFGCLYIPRQSPEIIVAGGYINGRLTAKCERYSVAKDQWTPLPDLNESKASSSLCLLNDRFLYCFGGLSRTPQGGAFLTNSIEMLDLCDPKAKWEKLPLTLPI